MWELRWTCAVAWVGLSFWWECLVVCGFLECSDLGVGFDCFEVLRKDRDIGKISRFIYRESNES